MPRCNNTNCEASDMPQREAVISGELENGGRYVTEKTNKDRKVQRKERIIRYGTGQGHPRTGHEGPEGLCSFFNISAR